MSAGEARKPAHLLPSKVTILLITKGLVPRGPESRYLF
jgi:hypothetical protein